MITKSERQSAQHAAIQAFTLRGCDKQWAQQKTDFWQKVGSKTRVKSEKQYAQMMHDIYQKLAS